ncbi:MAG TPA: M23/M56 family metallopeptidase [Duganella sp.]
MMTAYVLMFKWLVAGVGCVLAGMAICGLLKAALGVWPALAPRRNVWLAAQIVVACAALLPFLPHGEQISVAPAVTFDARETTAIRGLSLRDDDAEDARAHAHHAQHGEHAEQAEHAEATGSATHALHAAPPARPTSAPAAPSVLALALPVLWVALYMVGLAHALIKLRRARVVWRGVLASAQRLSPQALLAHGAFDERQLSEIADARLTVMETDATLSPVLIGWRRPVLLLPRHLREFSGEQQQMIVAHELQHWRVRDPLCLGVAAALQTIFWFNPALRWLGAKMTWALELACDQQVLAGRPQRQRKLYAGALLRQWETQTTTLPHGAVAFGGFQGAFEKGDTIAARLLHMQRTSLPALAPAAPWTVALLMALVLAAGAVLQPALAFNIGQQAKAAAVTAMANTPASPPSSSRPASGSSSGSSSDLPPPPAAAAWRHPLDKMRVSGFFGVWRSVSDKAHQGIDLAAPKGTPVRAAAPGKVIAAGQLAENDGRYGTTIIVDSGAEQTLYAHLNSMAVKAGERVEAGQLIGTVGETGFATGPHLHFEVRRNDRTVDPATLLADLDAHATKRALKVRRQQQGY